MKFKKTIFYVEKRGWISRRPKPIFVFLLAYAYILIWAVVSVLYFTYNIKSLDFIMYSVDLIALITFFFAIFHWYVVKTLEGKDYSLI